MYHVEQSLTVYATNIDVLQREDASDREADRQDFQKCLHGALMAGDDHHVLEILGVGRPEDASEIITALRRVLWPETEGYVDREVTRTTCLLLHNFLGLGMANNLELSHTSSKVEHTYYRTERMVTCRYLPRHVDMASDSSQANPLPSQCCK